MNNLELRLKEVREQLYDILVVLEDIVFEKEDCGNTWVPKLYAPYYYPDFEQPESVWRSQWTDTWTDNRIKNTVGIYKTKQQALDKAIKLGWLEEELK
jgi:hypothetical protein